MGSTITRLLELPQILEESFGLLNATAGIVVLLLALRIAPTLTLSSHRHALRIFVLAAILIVFSELVVLLKPFIQQVTFFDDAEELVKLLAISSGGFALHYISQAEQNEVASLRRSANVDELTSVSSRYFFRRAATRRIELSKNNDLPLTCAMLDVDDFKPYNDRHGHEAGDKVLRCVARVIRTSARADDLVARYGGEEFVLLMSSEVEEAVAALERIREGVEHECSPEHDASISRQITVSLGVAPLADDTQSLEHLVQAADREMYRAKRAGKNRICIEDTRA
ncbi:MAG: GGDEF domain-containing protein [Rubrobacter sp.]|nr:GGDEF domain-containing protein [Rubrobacter sp.]